MSRRRPNYVPPPRILSAYQVACRLGKSESWFRDNLAKLVSEGFPRKDDILNGWDSHAIEQWLDTRGGIVKYGPEEEDDWGALLDGDQIAVG